MIRCPSVLMARQVSTNFDGLVSNIILKEIWAIKQLIDYLYEKNTLTNVYS